MSWATRPAPATGRPLAGDRLAIILVADDDSKVRRTIVKALGGRGHAFLEAGNGIETMQLLAEHNPQLVITDIFMPDMDGIESILAIRRAAPGTKIIAMSGGGAGPSALYLAAAGKFGADALLEKPFAIDDLRAMVRQLLD